MARGSEGQIARAPISRSIRAGTHEMGERDLMDPRWLRFVSANRAATPFHHPAWALLLSECYGFRAFALTTEHADIISGGVPFAEVKRPFGARRWVSLPFTDLCAPLVEEPHLSGFLAVAAGRGEAAGVHQIEIHAPLEGSATHSRAEGVIHTLALDRDPNRVRGSFHKSQVIRSITRAQKSPIVVRTAASLGEFMQGYYPLHVRTRRRQGVPVQPKRFFELLWNRMLGRDLGFSLLAYSGSTPIAGAVFLAWNGTIIYKYGASDRAYLHLRPNHLIFWDAIRWACESGFHTFSFGRSDADNQGLRDFKSGWGAQEAELRYAGIGGQPSGVPLEGMLDLLGIVIRRSPLWVTTALGEILYPFVT